MAPNGLLVLDAPLQFDLSGCRLNQGADAEESAMGVFLLREAMAKVN